MALSAHGYFGTLDMTAGTYVLDYSPYFYRKPLAGGEAVLWPLISKREDLNDSLCTWFEDTNIATTVTSLSSGAGALLADTTDVDLALASGQVAAGFITIGTVLRDLAAGKRERVLVTAIAADTCTVTRAYGNVSDNTNTETHATGATWQVVAHLNAEGSSFGSTEGTNLVARTNYTSILDIQAQITRTASRRQMHAVGDPWEYEVSKHLRKFESMMEEHLIWGGGQQRASTPVPGSMSGIQDLIVDRGGSNVQTSTGAFSYEVFDDAMKTLWTNGYDAGTPFILIVPAAGKQYAAYIHESAMRAPYDSFATRGMKATHLVSTFGHEVPIIPSSKIQTDEFYILNMDLMAVRFVDTMLAYDLPLGTAGADKHARRFISEMSLELHNADKAHWYANGVTYTRPV